MHSFLPQLLLLTVCLEANGGEHCIGKDGHPYFCNGFCCAGLGCCSYSNLWYAWTLLALVVVACLCGCASCSMRRYHLAYQASQSRRQIANANGRRRSGDRQRSRQRQSTGRVSRYPRATYNSVNERGRGGYTQIPDISPPPYNYAAAPPPYSERQQ